MSDKGDRTDLNTKKLEDIENKLERVRADTHNINRILTLSNKNAIVEEIRKAVGRSEVRAAILLLTKEQLSAGELAKRLGVSSDNLAMYMRPLLVRGYVTVTKVGAQRYFERSELVELVGFESIPEFAKLLKSWQDGLGKETAAIETLAERRPEAV